MQFARRNWHYLVLLVVVGVIAAFVISSNRSPTMFSKVGNALDGDYSGPAGARPAAEAPQNAAALAAPPGAAIGGGATGTGSGSTTQTNATQPTLAQDQRMLIKTGTLGLVIKDVNSGFGQIGTIAGKYGGEVLQYTATKSGDVRYMDIVIRVESKSFESAMKDLRELEGIVEHKVDKAESQDVTEEYVDIESQLANLKLTEQQLRAIMEKATRTEDVLAVQREITNVRGQIEKLEGRKTYLDRRTTMSNIAIRLETPPAIANPLPASGRSFGGAIARAWSNSLAVLETLGIAIVSVVVFCWWVFPILLLGWLALRFARRNRQVPTALTPPPSPPPAATSGD